MEGTGSELFFGRTNELKDLERLRKKKTSSLVVVTGRRRVGKSRLITEFAKNDAFFIFSGIAPEQNVTAETQREQFSFQLSSQFGLPKFKCDGNTPIYNGHKK